MKESGGNEEEKNNFDYAKLSSERRLLRPFSLWDEISKMVSLRASEVVDMDMVELGAKWMLIS